MNTTFAIGIFITCCGALLAAYGFSRRHEPVEHEYRYEVTVTFYGDSHENLQRGFRNFTKYNDWKSGTVHGSGRDMGIKLYTVDAKRM